MKIKKCIVLLAVALLVPAFIALSAPKLSYAFPSVLGARVIGEEGITLDGYKVEDEGEPITLDTATPTFEGYTIPNAHVLLIIRSEPIERETLSDANGYWKYTFEEPLEAGQHTLSLKVTDSFGITSKEVLAATFIIPEVKAAETTSPAPTSTPLPKSPGINYLTITLIVLGSLLILGIIYALLMRRRRG